MRQLHSLTVAAAALAAVLLAAPAFAQPNVSPDPPDKEELAGLGCMAAGTAAVVAVSTLGLMTVAATGGAAASYANVALPVLGTAFAAGCGVGVLAAPGAAWLIDHYTNLLGGRPEAGYQESRLAD